MNIENFLLYKEKLLSEKRDWIDLSNISLKTYFHDQGMFIIPGNILNNCHLSVSNITDKFLSLLSLDNSYKKYTSTSNSVDISIQKLFEYFNERKWNIPSEMVEYNKKAKEKNIYVRDYSLLDFSNLNNGITLLSFYKKPYGLNYNDEDIENIKSWLEKDEKNILIIEMSSNIYYIPYFLHDFFKTNQVIFLLSLSDSYLLPDVFNLNILPHNELGKDIKSYFKDIEIKEENLILAYNALSIYKENAEKINTHLHFLKYKLKPYLSTLDKKYEYNDESYLFFSHKTHEDWLKENVISLPLELFGINSKGSIISSLTYDI